MIDPGWSAGEIRDAVALKVFHTRFDEAGIVMWCGSVSKTLAPGYRIGWVSPGKFKDKIIYIPNAADFTLSDEYLNNFDQIDLHYLQKLIKMVF